MTILTARQRTALGALVLLTVAALGCSSSTDATTGTNNSPYFIKFTANGTQSEYHDQIAFPIAASFAHTGIEYTAVVAGQSDAVATTGGTITLGAMDVAPIATNKSYGALQTVGTGGGFTLGQISYTIASIGYSNPDPNNDVRVAFTEITATTVRGTFSGTLKSTGRPNLSISGEFFAKRLN
jgi:hypothetical protein